MWNKQGQRPNRLDSVKDEAYHAKMATYCLGSMNNPTYLRYIQKCLINYSFYEGGDGQWIFEEDTVNFFLDESGDSRHRTKWVKNIIKPMVRQFMGNAIRLSYDAEAQCISPFVINKREMELKRIKGFEQVSKQFPFFEGIIKDNLPIGDTEEETEVIFENTFVEDYVEDINNLMEYISTEIKLTSEIKEELTRSLALYGMGIYKGGELNRDYTGGVVLPFFFGWDMSAMKRDLRDAEYQFDWGYYDAPSIFEKYQNIEKLHMESIKNYGNLNGSLNIHRFINNVYVNTAGKVPVYNVYWKDIEKKEAGWVKDEYGYPYFCYINDGLGYTDKDLIEAPTEDEKKRMNGKLKETVYHSFTRYAVIIPGEEIGSKSGDIVLEYGLVPYGEKYVRKPSECYFPYKIGTWDYERGNVLTPLDDVIDPQRFHNRIMSVVESHIINMRGTGTVISEDAISDSDGEAETMRKINGSKPITVDTSRVGSVQNAVGTYGTNIGQGTYQMFQVLGEIDKMIQDVTGVNDAMTGTQGGQDVLVGVLDAQIQRGSIVQEPFYAALTSILNGVFQQIASVGKEIYINNPQKLSMMVGDKGSVSIRLTDDHALMDYRIAVKRSESREQGVQAGNALLFTLLQAQLIDSVRFSNLFDRANTTMIARAMREYQREKLQAQYELDKINAQRVPEQQVAMAQQQQSIIDESANQRQAQVDDKLLTHELDMEKTAFIEDSKTSRDITLKQGNKA